MMGFQGIVIRNNNILLSKAHNSPVGHHQGLLINHTGSHEALHPMVASEVTTEITVKETGTGTAEREM